jgi:hypothetical protein
MDVKPNAALVGMPLAVDSRVKGAEDIRAAVDEKESLKTSHFPISEFPLSAL